EADSNHKGGFELRVGGDMSGRERARAGSSGETGGSASGRNHRKRPAPGIPIGSAGLTVRRVLDAPAGIAPRLRDPSRIFSGIASQLSGPPPLWRHRLLVVTCGRPTVHPYARSSRSSTTGCSARSESPAPAPRPAPPLPGRG